MTSMKTATLEKISIYPIKGCAEINCQSAILTSSGLKWDRAFLLIKPNNTFVSQRDNSAERLALLRPQLHDEHLTIHAPSTNNSLEVPLELQESAKVVDFSIHKDKCRGFHLGPKFDSWFSEFLRLPVRLIRFDPAFVRASDPFFVGNLQTRNLANDGYPIHTLSIESIEILNKNLIKNGGHPVSGTNFRANFIIKGLGPFGEDRHSDFFLPDRKIHLRNIKPCSRCGVTNVNQEAAQKLSGKDSPRLLLSTLRTLTDSKDQSAPMFGQNTIIASGHGKEVHIGDEFEVLEGPTGFREGENLNGLFEM